MFPGQNFAHSRWGWRTSENRDTAHIHRQEKSTVCSSSPAEVYTTRSHDISLFRQCSAHWLRLQESFSSNALSFSSGQSCFMGSFKDIYGLLNRSMGGVLIGRNHRFYLTYTVYNRCERLASVGKESISSWALLKCAWNLCKLLILMISSVCLYNNFPPNTHFPVNTQKSGKVQSDS